MRPIVCIFVPFQLFLFLYSEFGKNFNWQLIHHKMLTKFTREESLLKKICHVTSQNGWECFHIDLNINVVVLILSGDPSVC